MFPKLRLPPDILDCGFSLTTGPSFDDFNLNAIPANHPNVYGCGLIYRWRWTANYIVSDFTRWMHYAVPFGFPVGLTVWARGAALDKLIKLPSHQRPAKIREIQHLPGGISSTSHLATHAALQNHDKVYVLGVDGGHSCNWTPRLRRHATVFVEPWDILTLEQASRATIAVLMPMMAMFEKGDWDADKIVNLSTTSCTYHYLSTSDYCLSQPYGKIDRYSKLMVVYVEQFDPRYPRGLTLPRAVRFIRRFQEVQAAGPMPQTPLAIVSTPEAYQNVLAKLEDKEVIHCRDITPAVRCQFTHIVAMGSSRFAMMPY